MKQFEYEWWNVDVYEATGRITYEVKAKSRLGAEKQILRMASKHESEVKKVRQEFNVVIYWDTMKLDHKGYQRRF